MSHLLFLLDQLDDYCEQLATAIQASQPQLYAILALAVVAAFLCVPRQDDPDQI